MTAIHPIIRLMTPEEIRTNRLINAGSVIQMDGTTIPISAGRRDHVHIFKDSTVLYVLSVNYELEYLGMEIFDAASGEEFENIFLQYRWEIEEYLGSKWRDFPPQTIVRRLMDTLF